MGWLRYLWLVLRTAVRHSADLTQAILFFALIVFGVVAAVMPVAAPMMPDISGWQAATFVLGAIVLVRLLLAPYWLHEEQKQQVATRDRQIETLKTDGIKAEADAQAKLLAVQAKLDDRARRRDIRTALANFLEDGRILMARCAEEKQPAPEAEANAWAAEVEDYFRTALDDSYTARFRDGSNLPLGATSIMSPAHRNLWSGMRIRVSRLQEFIREYLD